MATYKTKTDTYLIDAYYDYEEYKMYTEFNNTADVGRIIVNDKIVLTFGPEDLNILIKQLEEIRDNCLSKV